jgi:hypothetical protein
VRLLPDGREEARHAPVASPGGTDLIWNGQMSADGRTLFATTCADGCTRRRILFLDLAAGALRGVDLPLHDPRSLATQEGLSHDGRRLYVFAPSAGEVAVVDLDDRRLEQSVLVDAAAARSEPHLLARALAGLRRLVVAEALAKSYSLGALQLSPDGRRLYAIGADPAHDDRPDGVWAIDTSTWRVTGRWLAGAWPVKLLQSADGRWLYVQEMPPPPGTGTGPLHVLDAATGVRRSVADGLSGQQLFSVVDLYRDTYGRSPVAARPSTPRQPPLAEMAVAVGPNTVVGGDAVAVELRFVDPSGRALAPGQPDLRYEPPARVTATLEPRHGGERQTLELAGAAHGVYRGSLALPAPSGHGEGVWSARAVAEWPDGLRRRAALDDAVVVQRPLAGTDGRRYVLQVATDPPRPVVDRPATVTAALVDAETRAPLPPGVDPVGGLPAAVEASFYGASGATTAELQPVGHGVYTGALRGLWSPGGWRIWAALQWPGRPWVSHAVGSVQAVRPPLPAPSG